MKKKKSFNILKKILAVMLVCITTVALVIGSTTKAKAGTSYTNINTLRNYHNGSGQTRLHSNGNEGNGENWRDFRDSYGRSACPVYKLRYKLDGDSTSWAMSFDGQSVEGEGGYEIKIKVDGTEVWYGYPTYRDGKEVVDGFTDEWKGIKLSDLYFTPITLNGITFLQINIELTNTNSVDKTISLATGGDIQIADDDNAAIQFLGNGFSMSNRYCVTSDFQGGDIRTATLNVYAKGNPFVTDADTVYVGHYGSRCINIWNNNVLGDTTSQYNFFKHGGKTGSDGGVDTGFEISWQNRNINAGETQTYQYIIGAGEYNPNNTLTFDANGGDFKKPGTNLYSSSNNSNKMTVTYDKTTHNSMSGDIPTRTGYTFDGWWTTKDESGVMIYDSTGKCNNDSIYWKDDRWQGFTDLTLYAHWTVNKYNQNIYVRYQNEDGSWGSYSNAYIDSDSGKTDKFTWNIEYGSIFTLEESDITDYDSRWNSDLYTFPKKFADGSSFSYKVTKAVNRYIDIRRKGYSVEFYPGISSEQDEDDNWMDDTDVYAGGSFTFPKNKYTGRKYSISFDTDGGNSINDIQGKLSFDYWKNRTDTNDDNEYGEGDDYSLVSSETVMEDMTFEAQWQNKVITLPTPTKTGYTFAGWYEDTKFTKKYNSNTITVEPDTTTYNKTLYAKWTPINYTISYNLDGGILPTGKTNPTTYTVEDEFTLNNPVKEGYVFAGWKGTGITSVSTKVIITKGSTGNRSYTATWTKEAPTTAHLKTFSGKGISSTNYSSGSNINIGTQVTVTATVKPGYKFVNWTDSNGNAKSTGKADDTHGYTFTMPNTDVNLTANATPIKYNIIFNSNKPSGATSNVTGSTANMNNISYDTSVTLTKNGYNLNGWKFAGWNTKADGSGTGYTDGQSVSNLTTTDGATITMYAKWVQGDGDLVTAVKGTGISATTGTGTYKDGASVSLNATVLKGYTWKANESTTGWFDSTGKKVSSKQNYEFTMTPGAKTYTANATPNTYTIKYNKNKTEATGSIADSSFTYDVKGTLRTNVFTATGYKQTGWNTKADGSGTHYDAGKAIEVLNWTDVDKAVITLYAEWTTQNASYTVKHHYMDLNGSYTDVVGLLETENLNAQVGNSVTPKTKARTGFTTPGTKTVIVKADGSTVVDYYYARNKYTVTLTKDDNIDTTTGNGDYYYGASVTVKATVKANTKQYTYNWNKWESSNTNILANSTNKDYTFTMPANDVTLKATGSNTVNSYKITVNGDSHVSKTSGGGTYKYGTQVTISADSFANGYQFSKWDDGNTSAKRTVTVTDNATYTATATAIPYSISYNLNGGISGVLNGKTNPTSYNVETDTFTLINPTRTGYTFTGWTGSNGTTPQTKVSIAKGSTGNKTYTANWKVNQYKVTYIDAVDSISGKELGRTTKQVDYGTQVNGSDLGADKTLGKYYAGYAYDYSTSEKVTTSGAVVYRIFRVHDYNITYNLNGGSVSKTNPTTYTVEDEFTLNNPSKIGYTFTGWSGTGLTGTANKTVTIKKGSTGDRAYTANYTINQYTVTYIDVSSSGIELGKTTKQIDYGKTVRGADLGSDKTLDKYYKGYEYSNDTSATVTTNGATVKRIFVPHTYTITYNLNGGNVNPANKTTYTIETADFTLNNPVKTGYTFLGWNGTGLTGTANKAVTIKKGSIGNRSYTANYTANKYSITYKKGNTDSTQSDITDNATYDSNYTMKAANTFTGRTYNVTYDKGYNSNRSWENTTLPSNITNAHLTFKNWSIEGTTKNAGDTFKYTYAKNVTATANWNPTSIKLTEVTRTGYTFTGWKCSVDGKVYKAGDTYTINESTSKLDVTFTATWTANSNTKYTVKHWKQNISGDANKHDDKNYTLSDTDNFTGTTDTKVTPSVKAYEGFTAPVKQTVNVNGDGSTVVNYYYTRNSYKLDLNAIVNGTKSSKLTETVKNPNTGKDETYNVALAKIEINGSVATNGNNVNDFYQDVFYGSTVKVTTTANTGYTVVDNTNTISITMPAKNTEVVPHVNANTNTKYVVRHWQQKLNTNASDHSDKSYTLKDTETLQGTTNRWVTPAVKSYTGFTAPNKQTVQIKADGSLVVNYYYTRNSYTLTVDPKDTSWIDGNKTYTSPVKFTLQYEETKTIADPSKTGYHLKNWSINPNNSGATISNKTFKMGYGNVTISPVMEANTITVNYNANGGDSSKNFSITEKYDNNFTIYNNTKINYYGVTRTPFTRTDCRFTGWKSNSGKAYASNWKGILNTANGFPENGNITFYAQWETDVQIQIYEQYVFKGTNDIAGVNKGYAGTNHNDNNDYYLADSFTKVSNVDTSFTYTPTGRTGFTTPSAVTINVTNGKPVIKVYYDRKNYSIVDPKKPDGNDKDPRDDSSLVKGGNNINVWLGAGIDSVNGTNAKKTYKYGEPVSLTANLKNGYHWHADGDCETNISTHPTGWIVKNVQSYNANKNNLTFNMPANDVSISVRATNNSYYVDFVSRKPSNASGNITGKTDKETLIYDETKALNKNGYSLIGWTFTGWISDNNTSYKDGTIVKNLTTANKGIVKLYTTWTANIYNIKFDPNTPSKSNGYDENTAASTIAKTDYSDTKYTYDSKIDKMPKATLEGWTFDGWYTEPDKNKGEKLDVNDYYRIPKDTTLYAHYTANKYTLRYEANNGTNDYFNETVVYDTTYKTAKNRYSKTGYSFTGWVSDKSGIWAKLSNDANVSWFKYSDNENVRIWTQNTGWYENSVLYWTGKYNKTHGCLLSDDTLKAQWRANNYTITFNYDTYKELYKNDSSLNGYIKLVKNGPDTIVVTYDSQVGTLPNPDVTGTKFIGWFDSPTGGKQYNPDTIYKEAKDITLYARYEQLTGTFTYKSNGITYNNNGIGEYKDTAVEDPTNYDVMTDYATLSENRFGKTADNNTNEYLVTDNDYKRIEVKEGNSYAVVKSTAEDDYYTFQGWSTYPYARKITDADAKLIHNAGYKDKFFMFIYENLAVKNELGTVDNIDAKTLRNMSVETGISNENKIRNSVNKLIADKNLSDGQTDVTLYAVWDKYPEITSETMTIPSNYLDNYLSNGSYNNTAKSELIKYIRKQKLSATDREDGDITNSIKFEGNAVDLIIDQFLTMKKTTGLTTRNVKVPVSVTDSVGNKTYDYIDLWINSVDPINKKEPDITDTSEEYKGQLLANNVRVISEEYYDTYKNADYSLETYKDYGGLMPYSLWYTDKDYKNVITECFKNFKNRTPEQTWYFTHDDVLKVQDFIEENGLGNSKKEADKETPLTTFYNTFKRVVKTE